MRSRPTHAPQLSGNQLQRYQHARACIRLANFDAAQLLISLAQTEDTAEARCACRELEVSTLGMKFSLRSCEQIMNDDFDPAAGQAEFIVHAPFGEVIENPADVCEEQESMPMPPVDTDWSREVDMLLWLVGEVVIHNVTEGSGFSACITRQVLACISNLSRVLLRQQRHLRMLASGSTQSKFLIVGISGQEGREDES